MKKFLLGLTLFFGINHTINSSYSTYFWNFAQKNAKSIKSSLTAGNLILYGALPPVAYKLGNAEMQKELEKVTPVLGQNDFKLEELNTRINQLISVNNQLTEKIGSFGKKEGSFLDNLGPIGLVLGTLFTGYRYIQHGLGEIQGFYQVINAINAIKHTLKDKVSANQVVEELQEQPQPYSNQRLEKMTPAQRTAFLRQHGFKG